jgi:hypothetical protein
LVISACEQADGLASLSACTRPGPTGTLPPGCRFSFISQAAPAPLCCAVHAAHCRAAQRSEGSVAPQRYRGAWACVPFHFPAWAALEERALHLRPQHWAARSATNYRPRLTAGENSADAPQRRPLDPPSVAFEEEQKSPYERHPASLLRTAGQLQPMGSPCPTKWLAPDGRKRHVRPGTAAWPALGCGEGHGPTLNGVEARQDYAIGLMALPRPDNPGLVVIFFSADRRPRRLQFCQREP